MFILFHPINSIDKCEFVNRVINNNNFYKNKYKFFYLRYGECNNNTFRFLPYLTKDELIDNNDLLITSPYKKCKLVCNNGCLNDIIKMDYNCSIGQSTGGTSGKSTFIWMNRMDILRYMNTFITSFRKNGYKYGEKILTFYPSDSYFTNEYYRSNKLLQSLFHILFHPFNRVDDTVAIEFVNSINTFKPDLLVIFPFVLLKLSIIIHRLGLKLLHFPRNINVSGEYLLNCTLNFIKKIFKCSNIENTYGAVEFGEIAHQIHGDKNTYEVFNNFCYLENLDNKIVVTSLINETFPVIRYVMEDIGTVVNKGDKQYIVDLIGKETNVININNRIFTSIDIDNMIDYVNENDNIVSIVILYDNNSIEVIYITLINNIFDRIISKTKHILGAIYPDIRCDVKFVLDYKHNYLKKFKIVKRKDKDDSEPVGGYYKY